MKATGKLKETARPLVFSALSHMPHARRAARQTYWNVKRHQYDSLAAKINVSPHTVFFESYGGRSYSCSPRALFETMLADDRFSNWEFIWSFRASVIEDCGLNHIQQFSRATIVQRGSAEYFSALAKSAVIIINTRLPEYVFPKQNQIYLQCWHGTPLKRLGFDVAESAGGALNTSSELSWRFKIDSQKWTYLLSPSPYASVHLADAFGLPKDTRTSTVLELGYPRNDCLTRERQTPNSALKETLRQKHGIPRGKKVLLLAPTFRDDSWKAGTGYTFELLPDFDALRRELADEWVILFRPHYYIANAFNFEKYEDFVIDASRQDDINELYLASDALVTDYSSVMFDYANLRRPILLYAPDIEHYATDIRGFYFDLHKAPGPCCTTTNELITELKRISSYEKRYGAAYEEFAAYFCPLDDGNTSKQVLKQVFE